MYKQLFVVTFLGITLISFSQNSYIQVISEPDISVFLDSQFKGKTTSDLNGLIISNVTPGQHIIKVSKDGYLPQEETIIIKPGEVFAYQVNKNFNPQVKISEQGNKENLAISIKKGNILLQSLPISIRISIPDLYINTVKTKDEWMAEQIPEGTYKAIYTYNDKVMTDYISVKNDMVSYSFVNMLSGKIENTKIYPISSPPVQEESGSESKSDYSIYGWLGCGILICIIMTLVFAK